MDTWLWTPLTQHVSRVFDRIRNIVDSPGGNPESEPELATATVETTGRRGATIFAESSFVYMQCLSLHRVIVHFHLISANQQMLLVCI